MSFLRAINMGLREIWGHKVRSALTLFCVLLGVASVVFTVGLIRGMTVSWREFLNERGGLERLRIRDDNVPEEQEHLISLSPGRTLNDARAIEELANFVRHVSPVIELNGNILYRGDKRARPFQLEAVEPQALIVERFEMEKGRFITAVDNELMTQVIVIGSEVRQELFTKLEDPIGKTIILQGVPFEVVGLTKHYEMGGGRGNWLRFKNNVAFIPLRTAQYKITNSLVIHDLDVQIKDVAHIDAAVAELENIMLRMHRGVDDFEVSTSESMSEGIQRTESTMLTMGGAISLTTMLVGGIGIMNLMLASINERVREIGIRKSVGAQPKDIFFQFCVESVTLCVIGGVFGVVLGVGIIHWLQAAMTESQPPVFTWFGVIAGFSASVTIGVLAGVYPAFRASRLDPIEALRYE